jgi:hypothetical protein
MDEYSADPKQTEQEAQRVLRGMRNAKARAEVADIGKEVASQRAAERAYTKPGMNTRAGGVGGEGAAADIKMLLNPKAMRKGGTASSRADGIATKGKTKGRIV